MNPKIYRENILELIEISITHPPRLPSLTLSLGFHLLAKYH